jgi:hypothetical protein
MGHKDRRRDWIDSLMEGDLVGIRWPDWPGSSSNIIKCVGIFIHNNAAASIATVIDPFGGELLCYHEQLFPIVKFVVKRDE